MQAGQRLHHYTMLYPAMAPAAVLPQSFQVETDYDFYWIKAEFFAYDAAGAATKSPLLAVLLQDGSSAQQLSNIYPPVAAVFGSGEIPYILPAPHLVKAGSTFNATVRNDSGAVTYTLYLVFSGLHVPAGTVLPSAQRSARMQRSAARIRRAA